MAHGVEVKKHRQ